eukprot:SAG22_NODE_11431_length_485_cov_1.051813_2_plen_117_part_00
MAASWPDMPCRHPRVARRLPLRPVGVSVEAAAAGIMTLRPGDHLNFDLLLNSDEKLHGPINWSESPVTARGLRSAFAKNFAKLAIVRQLQSGDDRNAAMELHCFKLGSSLPGRAGL